MLLSRSYLLKLFLLTSFFLILTGCAGPAGPTNFQTMLVNLSKSYPDLWKLATATSYVLGFAMIFKAVYAMKVYGQGMSMMSSSTSIKGPLMAFLAGSMLLFLPASFDMINMTFFNNTNILSYNGTGSGGFSIVSIRAVLGLVQFIGLLAFIRGWIYVAKAGEQSGGQHSIGKALTHIFAGALAINVVQVRDVIWNTFGFG